MKHISTLLIQLWKKQTVLCIAGLAALLSAFPVSFSPAAFASVDFRVLGLLFCLMSVVAGLRTAGVFEFLCRALAQKPATSRALALTLVLLCFFSSMLVTNDVSLLTFVPFAILTMELSGQQKHLPLVITMQTIAANLGSMLTPVGNPQNLYLYSNYAMTPGEFFPVTVPLTLAGLVLVCVGCLAVPQHPISFSLPQQKAPDRIKLIRYGPLFLLCLGTVFHLIPWQAVVAVVIVVMLICDRSLFLRVDYGLLVTFVFFFLFVGNLGQMETVRSLLSNLLTGRELWGGILLSQVISNVPAAVLLSGFTDYGAALLAGTNIGGLGTLVASLASLISYRLYCGIEGAKPGQYLGIFTAANLLCLIPMTLLGCLIV